MFTLALEIAHSISGYLHDVRENANKNDRNEQNVKTAIYARVSTRDKGQDTENQLTQLRAFAAAQDWSIIEEYVDQASGSGKQKRPAFDRMMSDAVARRFDMVLFWSLDRLSREGVGKTVGYLDKLTGAGVFWRSYTEQYLDSCGIFKDAVLAILAVVAKQERIRISERTIAGLATARTKGRVGGRKPKEKDEFRILELRRSGLSFAAVAKLTGVSRSTVDRISRLQLKSSNAPNPA